MPKSTTATPRVKSASNVRIAITVLFMAVTLVWGVYFRQVRNVFQY